MCDERFEQKGERRKLAGLAFVGEAVEHGASHSATEFDPFGNGRAKTDCRPSRDDRMNPARLRAGDFPPRGTASYSPAANRPSIHVSLLPPPSRNS